MLLELQPSAVAGREGVVHYGPAFRVGGRWHLPIQVATSPTLRQRVHTGLERHGLTAEAATRTRAVGSVLRDAMHRTRREWAALLDVETGEQLGNQVDGEVDAVSIEGLLRQCRPGRRYVALHTHPQNLPFSLQDA